VQGICPAYTFFPLALSSAKSETFSTATPVHDR
jgi:hypothetical protein